MCFDVKWRVSVCGNVCLFFRSPDKGDDVMIIIIEYLGVAYTRKEALKCVCVCVLVCACVCVYLCGVRVLCVNI